MERLEEKRGRQQEKLSMVRQTIRDLNRSVEQVGSLRETDGVPKRHVTI